MVCFRTVFHLSLTYGQRPKGDCYKMDNNDSRVMTGLK